jgi:hypothetical protein
MCERACRARRSSGGGAQFVLLLPRIPVPAAAIAAIAALQPHAPRLRALHAQPRRVVCAPRSNAGPRTGTEEEPIDVFGRRRRACALATGGGGKAAARDGSSGGGGGGGGGVLEASAHVTSLFSSRPVPSPPLARAPRSCRARVRWAAAAAAARRWCTHRRGGGGGGDGAERGDGGGVLRTLTFSWLDLAPRVSLRGSPDLAWPFHDLTWLETIVTPRAPPHRHSTRTRRS